MTETTTETETTMTTTQTPNTGPEPTVLGLPVRDVLAKLTEAVPAEHIELRQDGKATQRDGKWRARFVTYIEAGFVRQRLDAIVPFRWELEVSEPRPAKDQNGDDVLAIRATLAITLDDGRRLVRQDYGEGETYKAASTDAFKRVAVRWGIGAELYTFPQVWAEVDGDGKFARPVGDPRAELARLLEKEGRSLPGFEAPKPAPRQARRETRSDPVPVTPDSNVLKAYKSMNAEQREATLELLTAMQHQVFTDRERQQIDAWLAKAPGAAEIREKTEKARARIAKAA